MGFSLVFLTLRNGEQVDGDREGVRRFLDERGLHLRATVDVQPHLGDLFGVDGTALTLDGAHTDLHLDVLDSERRFGGGIWHAGLGPEECELIYALCVAGGFLICNPQGNPLFLVPAHNHAPDELDGIAAPDEVVVVESPGELRQALTAGFEHFIDWRDRVIEGDA